MFFSKNLVSFYTIISKEFGRILRIWPQTILPSIITISLYFLVFGNFIGKNLGIISGYNYIQYIVPGLIMMNVIINSYSNVVASFFASKFQKNIEELLISPTYNYIIIFGFISGGIIRSFIVFLFLTILSMFFCNFYFYSVSLFLFIFFITSIMFSLGGLLNGILAEKFDDINIILTFILTPLVYLGGIFYSVDLLPNIWKNFLYINPIFYIINVFRYSMLGISDINVYFSFFLMLIVIIILYSLCNFLLIIGYKIKN